MWRDLWRDLSRCMDSRGLGDRSLGDQVGQGSNGGGHRVGDLQARDRVINGVHMVHSRDRGDRGPGCDRGVNV